MNGFAKFAVAAAMTGALALAAASPSEARNGRNTAAAVGFGAGALVGAAVVGAANNGYYGPGYYEPGYAYEPGYTYAPDYAYVPRRGYYAYDAAAVAPYPYESGPRYYHRSRSGSRCGGSPGSTNYRPCD